MAAVSEIAIRTVADQVCDRLRRELLAGDHVVGSPMREEELAKKLGVSRHPIRKAIQQLVMEGLLSSKPNCGVVVAAPPKQHVQNLLTPMRQQLEIYALEQAMSKLTEEHRRYWMTIVQKMARAGEDSDAGEILDLDTAFHQFLLVVAGLEDMIPVWQGIYSRMREHHHQSNAKLTDLRYIAYVHQQLLNSLFCGKPKKARTDWESHLENGAFNKRALAAWNRQTNALEGNG